MRRPLALSSASLLAFLLILSAPAGPAAAAPDPGRPSPERPRTAVPGELLIGYRDGTGVAVRDRARGRAAARLAERVVRGSAGAAEVELVRLPVGIDPHRAAQLVAADPAVAYAEPNWIYTVDATASDPAFTSGELWGMYGPATSPANPYGSNAAAAWAAGRTGSASVYIGVIDEGLQYSHPDLSGRVRNPGETANGVDDDRNGRIDDVYGWDFSANNRSVYDGGSTGSADNHRTHVAGTIGAKGNGAGEARA